MDILGVGNLAILGNQFFTTPLATLDAVADVTLGHSVDASGAFLPNEAALLTGGYDPAEITLARYDYPYWSTKAYTVTNSAMLGGSWNMGGPVTVNAGGTLAPGGTNATARLHSKTNVTLTAGSIFRININGSAVLTQYDQLAMAGHTLDITGATLSITVGPGYNPASGTAFTIASGFTSLTGTFAGLPEGTEIQLLGSPIAFTISYDTVSSPKKIWLRARNKTPTRYSFF